eukprot:GILI01001226.1.p1 GENE.GILI01001226.1~~GILI01001226.1.p1  ORF type:complete len:204 (+),score=37.16 GILI01001226.1:33-614(+)
MMVFGQIRKPDQGYCLSGLTEGNHVVRNEDADRRFAIMISKCSSCTITVEARSVKVIIMDCQDVIVSLRGSIITSTVDIIHCSNSHFNFLTAALTVSVDMCSNVTCTFENREHFDTLLWSSCADELVVRIPDADNPSEFEEHRELNAPASESAGDLNTIRSQYCIRVMDGCLQSEKVVRVGGYPTIRRDSNSE